VLGTSSLSFPLHGWHSDLDCDGPLDVGLNTSLITAIGADQQSGPQECENTTATLLELNMLCDCSYFIQLMCVRERECVQAYGASAPKAIAVRASQPSGWISHLPPTNDKRYASHPQLSHYTAVDKTGRLPGTCAQSSTTAGCLPASLPPKSTHQLTTACRPAPPTVAELADMHGNAAN